MSYGNVVENYASAVQAELRKSILQLKQQNTPTKMSFKSGSGARGDANGSLVGLEIPFYNNVPHGESAIDPYTGQTSFEKYTAPTTNKMYVGLAMTAFTVESEFFHNNDQASGKIPENKFTRRDQAMKTYMQHHNWYCIGKGDGALAVATAATATLLTCANDNAARGRSKGCIRLAVSPGTVAGKRVEYQSYNTATDTLGATFYVTGRPNMTQVNIVLISGTISAGEVIVKKGHYKKVPYGLGYHMDYNNRQYQGVNTANATFLNSTRVNGGGAAPTPTLIDTAKGETQIAANDANARHNRVCHLTIGNYKVLAAFGYPSRRYNAEKGDANKTFGLPYVYSDEDTLFFQDADYEDSQIDMRDRTSYFEYRQRELTEISKGETQYVGINLVGSTEAYQNFGEACNLAWDGRGDDGKGKAGSSNSSVVIDNLAIPALNQVAQGRPLV